jgi:hypothetical protein
MDFTQLLYVVLISTAFLTAIVWASVTLFQYVSSQVRPSDVIVVGMFTTTGGGLPADAKAVGTILAAKLERLKRLADREPSGFGLVQTPSLTSVPDQASEHRSETRRRLEGLNLKVKDLDVNAAVDAVRSLFAPARPTLEGNVTEIGNRFEIRAELLWKGKTIGGWVASRPKSAQIQDTLNDLYDDLLFQIIYDIPHNPRLHWWVQSKGDDEIPNWQALGAITLGLQALLTYEQSLEYSDLQDAIKYLQRIPVYAPGYALGHYFLALALGEDRQEERAASLFYQVERMQTSKTVKWSAKFQRAAAMLRRYQGPSAEEAAAKALDPLIDELRSASGAADSAIDEEKRFARRLLPMADAQLAYTYGTLLTLKSHWSKDALKKLSAEASKKAWQDFDAADKSWPSEGRERQEVERWLYNTQGYSKFRIAYYVDRAEALRTGRPAAEVGKQFREDCDAALRDLREANRVLPNNYEVLQNEAMILDDEDYDPEGNHLAEAEALYERTKLFVPRDYYQYERLARIYWRQLKANPPATIQSSLIVKGQSAVSVARENRYPEKSRTAEALGAYFSALQAKLATDVGNKSNYLRATIPSAELAVKLNAPSNIAHDTARLLIEVARELTDTDPKEQALKKEVLEVAHKLEALRS